MQHTDCFSRKTVQQRTPITIVQPEAGKLVRELRQLTNLTQEQFAAEIGVTYGTINRWENGHMQPSRLALKQIKAVLIEMASSKDKALQERSQALLDQYFQQ